jgi:hypothetical protein
MLSMEVILVLSYVLFFLGFSLGASTRRAAALSAFKQHRFRRLSETLKARK